jgi:hypothetical protein
MKAVDVAIIGAGPTGLAATKVSRRTFLPSSRDDEPDRPPRLASDRHFGVVNRPCGIIGRGARLSGENLAPAVVARPSTK